MNRQAGISLLELVVSLGLASMLAAAGVRIIVAQYRINDELRTRADAAATMRAASLILADEFRRLGADSTGSDVIAVGINSIVYRAVRQWRFVCAVQPGASTLILEQAYIGMREIDPRKDSLSVYVEDADHWVAVGITGMAGAACPNGAAGVAATVGPWPGGSAPVIGVGAPVRAFALVEMKAYRGGAGRWWIGMHAKVAGRWPSIQPLLGPITPGGLEITAFDAGAVPTTIPTRIVRIDARVTVPWVTSARVRTSSSTRVSVVLRNGGA